MQDMNEAGLIWTVLIKRFNKDEIFISEKVDSAEKCKELRNPESQVDKNRRKKISSLRRNQKIESVA